MKWVLSAFLFVLLAGSTAAAAADPDGNDRAPAADIAVQTFSSETAFLAAAGQVVSTETFEGSAPAGTCDAGSAASIVFSRFTAAAIPPSVKLLGSDCLGTHNTTPGGTRYLLFDSDIFGVSPAGTLTFASPVLAVGFSVTDLDTADLGVVVNGVTYPVPASGDGGTSYFGIVSAAPFTTVGLQVTSGDDSSFGVDDVSFKGNDWRSGETDRGGGWRRTAWFGDYNVGFLPWIWHVQHGFLYPFDDGAGGVFFWDVSQGAFWWTKSEVYPFMYRFVTSASWLWYLQGTSSPRWFYDYGSGSWVSLP